MKNNRTREDLNPISWLRYKRDHTMLYKQSKELEIISIIKGVNNIHANKGLLTQLWLHHKSSEAKSYTLSSTSSPSGPRKGIRILNNHILSSCSRAPWHRCCPICGYDAAWLGYYTTPCSNLHNSLPVHYLSILMLMCLVNILNTMFPIKENDSWGPHTQILDPPSVMPTGSPI